MSKTSYSKFKDRCCNPFNLENHVRKNQKHCLRRVSASLLEKFDFLRANDVLCAPCRQKASKMERKDLREY